MQRERASHRQVIALQKRLVTFARSEFLEIDAIGDDLGRGAQSMFIEQIQGCNRWRCDVLATVTKMYQVRVGDLAEVLTDQWIGGKRATYIDRQVMIGRYYRF